MFEREIEEFCQVTPCGSSENRPLRLAERIVIALSVQYIAEPYVFDFFFKAVFRVFVEARRYLPQFKEKYRVKPVFDFFAVFIVIPDFVSFADFRVSEKRSDYIAHRSVGKEASYYVGEGEFLAVFKFFDKGEHAAESDVVQERYDSRYFAAVFVLPRPVAVSHSENVSESDSAERFFEHAVNRVEFDFVAAERDRQIFEFNIEQSRLEHADRLAVFVEIISVFVFNGVAVFVEFQFEKFAETFRYRKVVAREFGNRRDHVEPYLFAREFAVLIAHYVLYRKVHKAL